MQFNKRLLPVLAGCLSASASAGEAPSDRAGPIIEEVLVIGHPLSAEGLAQSHTVLAGEELDRKVADSIGATVGNEPGIHNSSFGVAAGRPVIHGLDGARVRVLEDRIDTLDVSVTSGDHAVTVDPFIADRVEILKGSATLLYGPGAIGGVVDTHTGRIPHDVPERITGKLDVRAGNNGDGRNGSFRLDGGAGNFAWHLDGFAREMDDYEIPGFAESSRSMAMEEEHDHDEGEEPVHGMVPGSGLEVFGGAAGFSFTGERGFMGVAVSRLDSEYGIPGHSHGHEQEGHEQEGHGQEEEEEDHDEEQGDDHDEDQEHGEEGTPFVDMEQTRVDFEAALSNPLPGFANLNLRLGINDYQHQEVEPSGEVGTAFDNQAWEARAELTHADWAGWNGAIGVQYGDRQFSVVGKEAFTPPVDTSSLGLFWVGERSFSGFQMEAGARFDRVGHEPVTGGSDSFSGVSASLGAIVPLGEVWEARLLADYSTRAPVGEELYSDGPHLATRSFEIGDRDLDEEKAVNLSASLDASGERWSMHGNLYYTEFSDFIYQRATGEAEDELVVRQFSQADATYIGLDLEAAATVAAWEAGDLEVSAFYDIVSADLDVSGNEDLARIPPARFGLGIALTWGSFGANLDYIHAFKQNDVADFELATGAYDDLRAYLGWYGGWGATSITVFLQGRNLTDEEQRLHTSIVKDLVPQPGRTIEGGIRIAF